MIINPLWFYIINLINNFSVLLLVSMGFILIIILIYLSITLDSKKVKTNWIYIKKSLIIFFIFLAVYTLLPSNDTMYKMLIFSGASEEEMNNINYILDNINNIKD